jgi:hypothetical protein
MFSRPARYRADPRVRVTSGRPQVTLGLSLPGRLWYCRAANGRATVCLSYTSIDQDPLWAEAAACSPKVRQAIRDWHGELRRTRLYRAHEQAALSGNHSSVVPSTNGSS